MSYVKWKTGDGQVRKNIYHSYLVREGRTMLKFLGDPKESKYKKGSASHFVYFNVPDDETDYCLAVEPECVEPITMAPKGVWLFVTAFGGTKEDQSGMIIEDESGPIMSGNIDYIEPIDAPKESAPVHRPNVQAPTNNPKERVQDAVALTVEAAQSFEMANIDMGPAELQAIFSTIYIQLHR